MKKLLESKSIVVVLFLLVIAIILTPFIIRYISSDPLFSGGEFYYNLRASQDLSQGIYWDFLQDRIHEISFFHYFLSALISFGGLKLLVFISILMALISVWVFFKIVSLLFKEKEIVMLSSFLFVLSPIFMYLFTSTNAYSLATLFSLIFIFLLLKKNYWSVLFLLLTSITNFSIFLIDIIILLSFFLYSRKQILFLANLIPSVIATLLFANFQKGFIIFENVISKPSFLEFFTSFGAQSGIAFFYLFIGIIGFFAIWKRKKSHHYFLISFILILTFSIFNVAGRIMLNFYLSVLSGVIICLLMKRQWAIIDIKKFTLLLIFCGIIFSTSLYLDQLIKSEPKSDLIEALSNLKNQEEGTVLSHQNYGFLIEYFSNKESFLDDSSSDYKNYDSLKNTEKEIFSSRNLEEAKILFEENNIKYLLITPAMKNGLVWKRESQGLLFLIENTNIFEELYSENNILLLEYTG